MKPFKTLLVGIFLTLVFCTLTSGVALAVPSVNFMYVEKDLGGGWWEYEYTLFNTSDSIADAGCDIYDVFITFYSPVYNIVKLPSGWDSSSGWDGAVGEGFIMAYSTIPGPPLDGGTDIAPGKSLGDFVFQFDYQAGALPFDATVSNPSPPYDPIKCNGSTAPVPEPGTLFLLSFGFIIAVGSRKVWKVRQDL